MNKILKAVPFYLGCNTSKGWFIGFYNEIIVVEDNELKKYYSLTNLGKEIFLYLRELKDLKDEESKILIDKGLAIGRPYGYTFTNFAFLYLIELHVDIFGFIKEGFALNKIN